MIQIRQLSILLILLVLPNLGQSQDRKNKTRAVWGGEFLFNVQEAVFLNASVGFQHFSSSGAFGDLNPDFSIAIKLGCDIGYKEELFLAPRLSLQGHIKKISWRTSASYLTNRTKYDWRLSPEIGYTWLNFFYAYYGYDFIMDNRDFNNIPNHKITVGFIFPFNDK